MIGTEVGLQLLFGVGAVLVAYLIALLCDWWRIKSFASGEMLTSQQLARLLSLSPLTSVGRTLKSMLLEQRVAQELLASQATQIDEVLAKATDREDLAAIVGGVIEEQFPLAYYGCALIGQKEVTDESAGIAIVGPAATCPVVVTKRITDYFNRQVITTTDTPVALHTRLGTSAAIEVIRSSQEGTVKLRLIVAYDGRVVISELEHERLRSIGAAAVRALDRVSSLEQSQHKTDAALQEAQEKQRLLSQVSHDMKSPLGVIQSVLHLLAKVPACAEYAELIAGASASASRSRELLEELLQFAALSARAAVVHPQWIDPVPIIRDELRRLSLIARQQQVKLTYGYPRCENHLMYFDPQALRRILANLVSNGLKFAKGKSVKVMLVPAPGGECHLEVRDTGVGIPPEGIAKLFKPFSRLHAEIEGTGLGLSICRDLAQLSGCSLRVESVVTVGTTFSLIIPRDRYRGTRQNQVAEVDRASAEASGGMPVIG